MRRGLAGSVVALVAGLALAACSAPATEGPLVGPRLGKGSVQVCAPAGADRLVYFGEPLTNSGDQPVTVTAVNGSGDNLASVDFAVDLQGPALDQVPGNFSLPASATSTAHGDEIVARMVAPAQAEIEPGAAATLILAPTAKDRSASAKVTLIKVEYTSGDKTYLESIHVVYQLHPGDTC